MMRLLTCFLTLLLLTPLAHSDELEDRANNVAALTPHFEGPNCWNTSMIVYGVLDNFRFTDLEEFEYYLRTYCRRLEADESMTHGTLIIEREYDESDFINEIVHSFVYFSDDSTFGKENRGPKALPQFSPLANAYFEADPDDLFFYRIPYGFSGTLAMPYSCDFSEKPVIPEDIKALMETFHELNTGKMSLTPEVYQDLAARTDSITNLDGRENHYGRRLMVSVCEQVRYYGKYLENAGHGPQAKPDYCPERHY